MPFTIVAYSESIDPAGALSNIQAVVDDTHRTNGDFVFIGSFNQLIGAAFFAGTTGVRGQLQSPSLRRVILQDISPVFNELAPTSHDSLRLHPESPIALETNEGLEALILSDPAAAEQESVVVFLSDGALAPVTGEIFTLRATGSITATTGAWASGSLTYSQDLPVGRYQLVGARIEGTNLVAARFLIPGVINRPGLLCNADDDDRADPRFRYGKLGVWAEFDSVTPPSLEIMASGANTSQVVYLDLIKVG